MNKAIKGIPCKDCIECIVNEYTLSAVQTKKVGPEMFEITGCELQNYGERELQSELENNPDAGEIL